MLEARKAFEMLAKELQRIRERDFYDTFSWLCDGQESPAEDDELKQKLERNDKEGDTKMNDILDKYVKEQEDKKTGRLFVYFYDKLCQCTIM